MLGGQRRARCAELDRRSRTDRARSGAGGGHSASAGTIIASQRPRTSAGRTTRHEQGLHTRSRIRRRRRRRRSAGPAALPAGVRNYLTPPGYARLRKELLDLLDVERPKIVEVVSWAAKNGDRSENGDYLYGKKRLREIDRRIRFLTKRLDIAEVADPSAHHGSDQIFFGATVTYCQRAGRGAHDHDQGRRRGRQPGGRGELGLTDRARALEGARRRRGAARGTGWRRDDRGDRGALPGAGVTTPRPPLRTGGAQRAGDV